MIKTPSPFLSGHIPPLGGEEMSVRIKSMGKCPKCLEIVRGLSAKCPAFVWFIRNQNGIKTHVRTFGKCPPFYLLEITHGHDPPFIVSYQQRNIRN